MEENEDSKRSWDEDGSMTRETGDGSGINPPSEGGYRGGSHKGRGSGDNPPRAGG